MRECGIVPPYREWLYNGTSSVEISRETKSHLARYDDTATNWVDTEMMLVNLQYTCTRGAMTGRGTSQDSPATSRTRPENITGTSINATTSVAQL